MPEIELRETPVRGKVVSCPDVMRSRARITSGNIGPKVGAGSVLSLECGNLQRDRYLVNEGVKKSNASELCTLVVQVF